MGGCLSRWIVTAIAVAAAIWLLPGWVSHPGDLYQIAIFALVLAVLNAFVRPVLTTVTLPLSIITLGLFIFFINAAVFWLATWLFPAVSVNGFGGAFLAALVVSVVSFVMNKFIR